MTIHPSITIDKLVRAVKRSMHDTANEGFCIACGRKTKPGQFVEPDARAYPCQFKSCGGNTVYGAEELLLMVQA